MNTIRGVLLLICVLALSVIALAACGGDDDDAKSSATATSQQTAAASKTPARGTETAAAAVPTTPAAVGTQPASAGLTADNTCALMTKSEVEDALGESVQEPVAVDVINTPVSGGVTAAVGGCGYTSESFASSISVTYWYAPGADAAIQGMIQLACSGKESISGLGDKACWYDQQHVQIQLASGGNFLDMFATMSGDASEVLTTLAKKAVGRMQ